MFWFIVFLLMLGAVFYMYQNLKTMEKEIREEQLREKELSSQPKAPEPEPAVVKVEEKIQPSGDSDNNSVAATEDNEIVALIKANPGIKQTELYTRVETFNTKQVQQMLKKMADAGEIKRQKEGSSYKLFV